MPLEMEQARMTLVAWPGRSLLILLTVAIGSCAWLVAVSLTEALRRQLADPMQALGVQEIAIRVKESRPDRAGQTHGAPPQLSVRDLAAVRGLPCVAAASPRIVGVANLGAGPLRPGAVALEGSGLEGLQFGERSLTAGRFFSALEMSRSIAVAVIGDDIARHLFPGRSPVGALLQIAALSYRVLGVFEEGETAWGSSHARRVLLPWMHVDRRSLHSMPSNAQILVLLQAAANRRQAVEEIRAALRRSRRLHTWRPDDFEIQSAVELQIRMEALWRRFSLLVAVVAGLSSLVASTGILNLQLLVVQQRASEIGLRRAVGALQRQVVRQFLLEGLLLCGTGGVVGVTASIALCAWITHVVPLDPVPSYGGLLFSLGSSLAVGLMSGVWPAARAAAIDPIQALQAA